MAAWPLQATARLNLVAPRGSARGLPQSRTRPRRDAATSMGRNTGGPSRRSDCSVGRWRGESNGSVRRSRRGRQGSVRRCGWRGRSWPWSADRSSGLRRARAPAGTARSPPGWCCASLRISAMFMTITPGPALPEKGRTTLHAALPTQPGSEPRRLPQAVAPCCEPRRLGGLGCKGREADRALR
jgi:hypothetical protein